MCSRCSSVYAVLSLVYIISFMYKYIYFYFVCIINMQICVLLTPMHVLPISLLQFYHYYYLTLVFFRWLAEVSSIFFTVTIIASNKLIVIWFNNTLLQKVKKIQHFAKGLYLPVRFHDLTLSFAGCLFPLSGNCLFSVFVFNCRYSMKQQSCNN